MRAEPKIVTLGTSAKGVKRLNASRISRRAALVILRLRRSAPSPASPATVTRISMSWSRSAVAGAASSTSTSRRSSSALPVWFRDMLTEAEATAWRRAYHPGFGAGRWGRLQACLSAVLLVVTSLVVMVALLAGVTWFEQRVLSPKSIILHTARCRSAKVEHVERLVQLEAERLLAAEDLATRS